MPTNLQTYTAHLVQHKVTNVLYRVVVNNNSIQRISFNQNCKVKSISQQTFNKLYTILETQVHTPTPINQLENF